MTLNSPLLMAHKKIALFESSKIFENSMLNLKMTDSPRMISMNASETLEGQDQLFSQPWISLKDFGKCHWINSEQHMDNLNDRTMDVLPAFKVWWKKSCKELSIYLSALMSSYCITKPMQNTELNMKIIYCVVSGV